MVELSAQALDSVFAALGDPTRRAIVAQLAQGPTAISKLSIPRRMSLQGVMKHVGVLEQAGLVTRHKTGRVVECRLNPEALQTAGDWIARHRQFWEAQFDSLAGYLDAAESGKETT